MYPSVLDRIDDDVLGLICQASEEENLSLNALSLTSKRLRAHSIPYIFKKIYICSGSYPWEHLTSMLSSWNPSFTDFVREIYVCIKLEQEYPLHEDRYDPNLPTRLAAALLQFSGPTSRITSLEVIIEKNAAYLFTKTFADYGLFFPNVQSLTLAPFNDFMVTHCPNTELLYGSEEEWIRSQSGEMAGLHSFDLLRAAKTLPKLRLFSMMECWTQPLLEALCSHILRVETLIIPREIRFSFEIFLNIISRLKNTKILCIPGADKLCVGFNPPSCNDAYKGPDGYELRKRVKQQGDAARLRVATQCFDRCKNLQELWFETYYKAVVLNCRGEREVRVEYVKDFQQPTWYQVR